MFDIPPVRHITLAEIRKKNGNMTYDQLKALGEQLCSETRGQINNGETQIDSQIVSQLLEKDREKLRSLLPSAMAKSTTTNQFPKKGNKYFYIEQDLIDLTFGLFCPQVYNRKTKRFHLHLITNITKDSCDMHSQKFVEYDDIKDLIKDLETFVNEKSYKKYYIIGGISLLVILITSGIGIYFYKKKTPKSQEETKPIENKET